MFEESRQQRRTFGNRLQEASQNEGEVVPRVEAMPKSASDERRHTSSKARFLTARGYTKVHVIPQPEIGIYIPTLQVCPSVLCGLNTPGVDVLKSIPNDPTSLGVHTFVSHAGENTSSLRERPYPVILQPRREAKYV